MNRLLDYSRGKLAPLFLRALLILTVLLGTGCDERYLASLTPEQRATLLEWMRTMEPVLPSEPEIPVAEARSSSPTVDPQAGYYKNLSFDDQCQALLETTPRGLACLHCTHPNADSQARILALLLFRSCLTNVSLNYLVDGTFSHNETLLRDHIDLLTTNGRRFFMVFYLSNGPNQRRYDSTSIESFGGSVSPETFRKRIQTDVLLRTQYQELINRLVPVLRYAQTKGVQISLIPMLEDNLDDQAFYAMYRLTLDSLPIDLYASIGRNPCPSCYEGNTSGRPQGVFLEKHTTSANSSTIDGILTNDGKTYEFPSGGLTLEDLASVRDHAESTNNNFILWHAGRQGLPWTSRSQGRYPHPDFREYEIPSLEERRAIVDFLLAQ